MAEKDFCAYHIYRCKIQLQISTNYFVSSGGTVRYIERTHTHTHTHTRFFFSPWLQLNYCL